MVDHQLEHKICSFCGRTGSPSNRLAGGLGAMICLDCLEHYCAETRDAAAVAEKTGAVWDEMPTPELLSTLPLILLSAAQNQAFAYEWVELLRQRGASWAEIGNALGVTRQAAWERFAGKSARSRDALG